DKKEFAQVVSANQAKLTSELRRRYHFIVCGSGSSGSVVARRLAENPEASVLLLEASGNDDVPSVMEAGQWPLNLGSDRDWAFQAQPNPHLNGRSIPMNMGKVLGWIKYQCNDLGARAQKRPGTTLPPRRAIRRGAMSRS